MIRSTHSGTVNLGGAEPVVCYVLEDGTRVLVASQIQGILGASKNRNLKRQLARLSHGSDDLNLLPVPFISPGGEALGYTAEDVVKVLRAYQRAFLRGELHEKQEPMAMAAMAAIEAFAAVGLAALIDEATGYQAVRPIDDLQTRFAKIFRANMRIWELEFDADWDRTLCQLYKQPYDNRPPLFAASINAMVYRFAFGEEAYSELKTRNPTPRHRSNHHQILTDDARILLSQTINTVKGIAKVSRDGGDFMRKLGVVFRDAPNQLDWTS
jgi:hypothetical protein